MKILSCNRCAFEAQGETFEDWMNALKPHYAEAHADMMAEKSLLSVEQQQAEMGQWIAVNRARFERGK